MEYFWGALTTIMIIIAINLITRSSSTKVGNTPIRYTQSHIYSLIAPLLEYLPKESFKLNTQSGKYIESSYIRIVVVDKSAYWIRDHALYRADMVGDSLDRSTTRRVDTMTMDEVELERTLLIVEKLREGLDHDSGSSGKP